MKIIDVPGHGEVEFPDEMSDQAISAAIQKNIVKTPPAPNPESGFSVGKMIQNIPSSGAEYAGNILHAVRHPIDTASSVLDLAAGGLQKVMPESVVQALDSPNAQRARQSAEAVGQFYKDRYGSGQGALKTLQNDPVGVVGDLSTVLTGGGAGASRIPGLARAGQAVSRAGSNIEPLVAALRGTSRAIPAAGGLVADVVGGIGTHTGGIPLREAAAAGAEGGPRADAFLANMRGNVPPSDVVDQARAALQTIRQNRGAAYREGMGQIGQDPTVLDMRPIAEAFNRQSQTGSYKGQVINPSTTQTQQQISHAISQWMQLDPAEYHTPEGLDALKRQIGDIRDSTEHGTPSRVVADNAYHAVRDQITRQAPEYARVMGDYEQASDLVRQIESSLSLNHRASADTALRKLQSLMRNNVNTNYGERARLGQALADQGGAEYMMPALAGQALNQVTPRGLGNAQAAATVGAGLLTGNAAAIPLALAQSPRIAGEAAYYTGKLSNALRQPKRALDARISPADQAALINALRQSGQLSQEGSP